MKLGRGRGDGLGGGAHGDLGGDVGQAVELDRLETARQRVGVGTDSQGPGPTEGELDDELVHTARLDPGVFGAHLQGSGAGEAPSGRQVGGGEGGEGGRADGEKGDVQVGVTGRGRGGGQLDGEGHLKGRRALVGVSALRLL